MVRMSLIPCTSQCVYQQISHFQLGTAEID